MKQPVRNTPTQKKTTQAQKNKKQAQKVSETAATQDQTTQTKNKGLRFIGPLTLSCRPSGRKKKVKLLFSVSLDHHQVLYSLSMPTHQPLISSLDSSRMKYGNCS